MPDFVGYESDEDLDNGFRPAGLIHLSTTTGSTPQYLRDFGNVVTAGTTTHHMTLYRAPSGALVFGAGTINYAYALDADHDVNLGAVDPAVQQATINLLADMGAQPSSLMAGMVAASQTTDTTPPVVTITSPNSSTLANGQSVTVTGTATDVGGQVAGVEVSTDGGTRWHQATGTTSWTYTGVVHGLGAGVVQVRASDDSANVSPPVQLGATTSCPCSILGSMVPSVVDSGDGSPVELGMRFTASVSGFVTGVRFYKSTPNTGTHVGTLWTASGTQLATGTFTNETSSGWQTLTFSSPVSVTAGTTYVVSYYAPVGHYSVGTGAAPDSFWYHDKVSGPLRAFAADPTVGNGVYAAGHGFPTQTYNGTNYYVDIQFTNVDTFPPTVTAMSPLAGSGSNPTSVTPSATFSKAVDPASVVMSVTPSGGAPVAGSVSYDVASMTATFTPSSALANATGYTVSVSATDTSGNAMASPVTWTFWTQSAGGGTTCPCSVWNDSVVPAVNGTDPDAVGLGMSFSPTVDGQIIGVRFYKGPENTGTHTGSLWAADGTLLNSVTFSNETTSGWQTALFASPTAVTAGTRYVISYFAPVGHYSYDLGGLANPISKPPLNVPAHAGWYAYGSAPAFPTHNSDTNYWVDPVFTVPDSVVPAVTSVNPGDGASSVPVSSTVTVQFNTVIAAGSGSVSVTASGGAAVAGTVTQPSAGQLVFTPSSPLASDTAYTVSVTGATSLSGTPMTAMTPTTFHTSGTASCPCQLFSTTSVPTTPDGQDPNAITLGVRFTASVNGYISGVKFYKSAANTGTHTVSLWATDGTRLATATVSNETASGWQSAGFTQPVAVTAGTTYVAGYYAPAGHYSYDGGFYTNAWVNTPLTGTAGTYTYSTDGYPANAGTANYWVTPVFNTGTPPDTTPPTVTAMSPLAGSGSNPTSVTPSATFSKAVDPASVVMSVTPSGGAPVAGSVSYDVASMTATFTPSSALANATGYTVSVSATDTSGNAMASPVTWTFWTQSAGGGTTCPCSVWNDGVVPAVNGTDPDAVGLGMSFSPTVDGQIIGVRFYKGPENTGTHTGSLWAADGTLLNSVTFSNETTSGWQTALFASPTAVTAGTRYVISYFAPVGHYSYDLGGLANPISKPPLNVPAHAGWYAYGSAPAFPTHNSDTNYWVDPVFTVPASVVPAVTSVDPGDGASSVPVSSTVTVQFNTAIAAGSGSVSVTASGGAAVAGTVTQPSAGQLVFTPSSPLASDTAYTVSVTGATSLSGTPMTAMTPTTFHTSGTASCPCQLFSTTSVPTTPDGQDPNAITLGVRFTASVNGYISGVKFYKSAANTGTHTVSLWATDGTRLATATVSNETASGWQSADFTQPVAVTAGTTYVAGYYAPAGHYSYDGGFYTNAWVNTPLTGTAGTYTYSTDGYPANAGTANYWVTPVFNTGTPPDTTPPVTSGISVSPGTTTATVTWTTDESSSSTVSFGTSTSLGNTAAGAAGTSHSVTLSGLTAGTTYYFRVTSVDSSGNSATSPAATTAPLSFTTSGTVAAPLDTTAPVISGVSATATGTSATVAWTTNESSTSSVSYGTTTSLGSTATGSSGTSHSVALSGLAPGTTYYYRVSSTDAAGNAAMSPDGSLAPATFQTQAPPVITAVGATGSGTSATVTWTTDTTATSTVDYGTTTSLGSTATGAGGTSHSVALSGLTPNTRYYYRVTSTNAAGLSATSPATSSPPAQYVPTVQPLLQTTVADFSAGSGGYVADTSGGEVMPTPLLGAEMSGTALPASLTSTTLTTGGTTTVANGMATLSGTRITSATRASGASVNVKAQLEPGQTLGWGSTAPATSSLTASFTVSSSGALSVEAVDGRTTNRTIALSGTWTDAPHVYQVDWTSTAATFSIDGTVVGNVPFKPVAKLQIVAADPILDLTAMTIDWLRIAPYASSTTYTSSVVDAGATVGWDTLTAVLNLPTGTGATVRVRTGNTASPDSSWTSWTTVSANGGTLGGSSRYLQYQVTLTTSGTRFVAPALTSVSIAYHVL